MATEYFKKLIGETVYIVAFDTDTLQSQMYRKADLVTEKRDAEQRLAAIPTQPTNAQLLAWARANYPQMDYGPEIAALTAVIAKNAAILEAVN